MVDDYWRKIFTHLPDNFVLNGWRRPGLWLTLFISFFFSLITYSKGIIHRLLINYFFRHVGLLSYSLYLSHIFQAISISIYYSVCVLIERLSFICACVCVFHLFIYSCMYSSIHSFVHLFINLFIHSFIRSFINLFI